MRKILILALVVVLFACGCNRKEKVTDDPIIEDNIIENKDDEKPVYVDDNPIKVGLYASINGTTTLVDNYNYTWGRYSDYIVFSTFYTQDKYLSPNSVAGTFDTYKNRYTNIDNYKIGYNVKFTSKDGLVINQTILNPTDANQVIYTSYLLVYAYDDLFHRNDNWYSHITEEEYNNTTMMTSFKVTGGHNYDSIVSDIEITVFTYNGPEDFDENGKYRGISKFTAILKRI